jgi:hypothetical protein
MANVQQSGPSVTRFGGNLRKISHRAFGLVRANAAARMINLPDFGWAGVIRVRSGV